MLVARGIFVGDRVEKQTGKHAGLIGRVSQKRPRNAQFATHIMVDVDYTKISTDNHERKLLRRDLAEWQSVETWKRLG